MMHEEFEKMVSYRVSYKVYHEIIEPMYEATDLSKQEFASVVNFRDYHKKQESRCVEQMRQIASVLRDSNFQLASYVSRLDSLLDSLQDIRGYDNEHLYPNATYVWKVHGNHPYPAEVDLYGDHVERWALV